MNQKGGCGKTTTAINLGAAAAARGIRTLLVDMDPQGHCAAGLGVPIDRIETGVVEAMLATQPDPEALDRLWPVGRNLSLLPSTIMLALQESPEGELSRLADRDRRLESALGALRGHHDLCLIDCPPSIGLLTFNALRSAGEAIVPVETGYFALQGAHRQRQTIDALVHRLSRPLQCRMLPTLHDPTSPLAVKILATLRQHFDDVLIPVQVREHEAFRVAASLGRSVVEHEPQSQARYDIEMLLDWLLANIPGDLPLPTETAVPNSRVAEIAQRVESNERPVPEMPLTVTFGVEVTSTGIRFRQPGDEHQALAVCGDFNGWSMSATPMVFNQETRSFEATVPLPPGEYRYQIAVDGRMHRDPYNDVETGSDPDRPISRLVVDGGLAP
ncbi:MAG: AAA family ATPase [Phycisphaerales bacterium]|nr:AAA family ATPase [Phycisphaerales bacterium]